MQFITGPESFQSFEEILARTREFNPTRSESSLRRGVLHNAMRRKDGRWVWRYQRPRLLEDPDVDLPADFATLWEDVLKIAVPLLLVRGGASGSGVDDTQVTELWRRQPDARVESIEGAGHSIQGDRPLELARLLDEFLDA